MGYPWGAANDPLAPWNQPDNEHLFECDACQKILNKYEDGDPCVIDGRTVCDLCASDLTALRIDGVLGAVSLKTKKLKNEDNN